MSPDPALTLITYGEFVLCGTLTTLLPEDALASTRYSVRPGGSTKRTFPSELLTLTRRGTLVNVNVTSPDPAEAVTSALASPLTVMSPEPLSNVTCGPDSPVPA